MERRGQESSISSYVLRGNLFLAKVYGPHKIQKLCNVYEGAGADDQKRVFSFGQRLNLFFVGFRLKNKNFLIKFMKKFAINFYVEFTN